MCFSHPLPSLLAITYGNMKQSMTPLMLITAAQKQEEQRAQIFLFFSNQNDDAGLLQASIQDGFNSPIRGKFICCVHVIFAVITESIMNETVHEVGNVHTWILQEISESSSNRIVQRTSWSKERMLGLRNRSIFILLSIQFQLLMSPDPRAEADAHVDYTYRLHTHRETRMHM